MNCSVCSRYLRAKADYSYPTIRLPHTFSMLAGLPARIYQTVHEGALAFLGDNNKDAVTENSADPSENAQINKTSVFTRRRSCVRIASGPSFFLQSEVLEPSIGILSDSRIMVKKKHNKDKKLCNSDEKLHNSPELDLTWQEEVDLQPEDEVEGGSEIYYFTNEDGNTRSREFLAEELISDEKEVEDTIKRKSSGDLQKLKAGAVEIIGLRAPDEAHQQVTLPVPKSGEPPLDIRLSSEVVRDLPVKGDLQQLNDVLTANKQVIIKLSDSSANSNMRLFYMIAMNIRPSRFISQERSSTHISHTVAKGWQRNPCLVVQVLPRLSRRIFF